ncbi:uncharacterized protein LOC106158908 [Lingula anatina]|uniref:Uncharacterized protein LOC106158908 n=1 Tax=Lingula anatina TaxID=7574 RepID=A0A1S3HWR8_LINAN|nr:uncharacterized protein LOC106158908 [Lingula anatina]|eukprot:XP_013390487.1 uncharacterized protein LOC106158908 [Lingula anatina]
MNISFEDAPARSHMDDDLIRWRCNKPNYDVVNELYLKERSKTHKPNSVEKTIENLVKTFEMELTNKKIPKEWKSIAYDVFKMQINGGKYFSADELADVGSYNALLADAPLFKATGEKQEILHGQYKEAFPGGFAWEVLDVISGRYQCVASGRPEMGWEDCMPWVCIHLPLYGQVVVGTVLFYSLQHVSLYVSFCACAINLK